ncbi:DUF3784 domain-containing protein [Bacillus atrophaeus]|uniref:DUF3784 domain-containing protein n=1 Tax=Bacillus atrophaeus TaxID=1452 RepID=UPI0007792925|nr:DUF3784 domain-containing protein [Bacillus atrophaeus]KYD04577.1 hypothetical protein B4144_1173 [Bacillus atrophaeus]
MDFSINYMLMIISLFFFLVAYYVGIKKQTWILAGFNEARIRDKDRLARIAGCFFLNSGLFILLNSFIAFPGQEQLIPPLILAYGAGVIIYVNKKLVE